MAPSKPSPHTKLAIDGIAATSTDAQLAAITARLKISLERMEQSRMSLATGVRRSGVKMHKLEAATTSLLAATTSSQSAPGRALEQRTIKASSPSLFSTHQVAAAGRMLASRARLDIPTTPLEVAPPAHRPPELVPFRVAGRMAEPFPVDLVVNCTSEGVGLMEAEESFSSAEFNGAKRPPASALMDTTQASAAIMNGSLFAPDPVREQQETEPSSPSFISTHRAVFAGALHTDTVVTPSMSTRCSMVGSAVNFGNNHAAVAFPTSGMAHLCATNPGNNTLTGLAGSVTKKPAGCSTHGPPDVPAARALDIDTKMSVEVLTHVGGLSLFEELELYSGYEVFHDSPLKDVVWDDDTCDDEFTHEGSLSLFLELGLAVAEDGSAERLSKDMTPDEELDGCVVTYIDKSSLFLEHSVQPAGVFSELHSMELADTVLTHVGDQSLFSEHTMVSRCSEATLAWSRHLLPTTVAHISCNQLDPFMCADQVCEESDALVHKECATGVVCKLISAEPLMVWNDKPTRVEHEVDGVGQGKINAILSKLHQLLLKEMQHGSNIAPFSLSWDPGGCPLQLICHASSLDLEMQQQGKVNAILRLLWDRGKHEFQLQDLDWQFTNAGGSLTAIPRLPDMIEHTVNSIANDMLQWPHRLVVPVGVSVGTSELELKPEGKLSVSVAKAMSRKYKALIGHEQVAEIGGVWKITNTGATYWSGAVQFPLYLKLEMHATLHHEQSTTVNGVLVVIAELLLSLQGLERLDLTVSGPQGVYQIVVMPVMTCGEILDAYVQWDPGIRGFLMQPLI